MMAHVRKWGTDLLLLIPKALAAKANLRLDDAVDVSLVGGMLVIQRLTDKPISLQGLLQDITEENLHAAWDTGPPVGKELL